jgi:lysyl-tRNA synthetase class I
MDNLTPEQIHQMIGMLKSMLPDQQAQDEDNSQEKLVSETSIKNRPSKKISGTFSNKFDQMMEAKLHKEDTEIDKALSVYGPTPRQRKFEPVKVLCRLCGKSEMVNPAVLSESKDRYKCNACSRSPG